MTYRKPFALAAILVALAAPAEAMDLLAALHQLQIVGFRDPLLVWKTGVAIAGLPGEGVDGELLTMERTSDAPAMLLLPLPRGGPFVLRMRWGKALPAIEWDEAVPEYWHVPGAARNVGIYRVRPTAALRKAWTREVEQAAAALLTYGGVAGSDLERHLIRAMFAASPREPSRAVRTFLQRMIPLRCDGVLTALRESAGSSD